MRAVPRGAACTGRIDARTDTRTGHRRNGEE